MRPSLDRRTLDPWATCRTDPGLESPGLTYSADVGWLTDGIRWWIGWNSPAQRLPLLDPHRKVLQAHERQVAFDLSLGDKGDDYSVWQLLVIHNRAVQHTRVHRHLTYEAAEWLSWDGLLNMEHLTKIPVSVFFEYQTLQRELKPLERRPADNQQAMREQQKELNRLRDALAEIEKEWIYKR